MRFNVVSLILATLAIAGCSGHGLNDPIAPSGVIVVDQIGVETNRHLWGIWDVHVSAERETAEITPLRTADLHLNAVRLLEVMPCETCLTIDNLHANGPNEFEADLTLTHPYPGLLKFTAFDVRGIFISEADYTFPVSGRKIALGDAVPRMLDPDAYTTLFNPTDFPPANPPALGYIEGKYATGGDLSATLNPFVAFRKDAPRCMFEAGGSETKTVRIYAPTGPLQFGYAVDVCWQLVDEVVDPLTDFPPDANCLEAYRISVEVGGEITAEVGGEAPIEVRVWDHQGQETIESVNIEAPDLFSGELPLTFSTVMPDEACLFTGIVPNYLGAPVGEYPVLVRVADTVPDQNLGVIDAWQLSQATVVPAHGWALTWGGVESEIGRDVVVDNWGHIYIVGGFQDTVDFDPGLGEDYHSSNGATDIFLSKFDLGGNFEWARTWGGTDVTGEDGYAVAVDGSGGVYVAGTFRDGVDFDPGPGEETYTSNGQSDVFLSKFDSSGNFLWARTWGGIELDFAYGIEVDSAGSSFVCGRFNGTVDFDPGSGNDAHTSNGVRDTFLSKFDTDGNFQWARTWGGDEGDDAGYGVAVDGIGDIYVCGEFKGTGDFDPGDGTDYHSTISIDVFLSKFDTNGNFIWARTWGGPLGFGTGFDVAANGMGDLYVTGQFRGTVDFDPGDGEDLHFSSYDAIFLSKFDASGNFHWARTWGGVVSAIGDDGGWGVTADNSGNVYVTGRFNDSIDFDPGSGFDIHLSNGYSDIFLSKFNSGGDFVWTRTWGGSYFDGALGVAISGSQSALVTGRFYSDQVDFDPSAGVDIHNTNGPSDVFLSKFLQDGSW